MARAAVQQCRDRFSYPFTSSCGDEEISKFMVVGRNDVFDVEIRVHLQQPASEQEPGSLVRFVEALGGGYLEGEGSRCVDRIRLGLGSRECSIDTIKVVVLGNSVSSLGDRGPPRCRRSLR